MTETSAQEHQAGTHPPNRESVALRGLIQPLRVITNRIAQHHRQANMYIHTRQQITTKPIA